MKCLGFGVPDEFVISYGKDFAGTYRNLPDIRVLTRDGGYPLD